MLPWGSIGMESSYPRLRAPAAMWSSGAVWSVRLPSAVLFVQLNRLASTLNLGRLGPACCYCCCVKLSWPSPCCC